MKTTQKFTYPIPDGENRFQFVRYPVRKYGKWYAADVTEGGYTDPKKQLRTPFETQEECQKSCDAHNSYLGLSKTDAALIVGWSMGKVKDISHIKPKR